MNIRDIRLKLGLTTTQAGKLILGIENSKAAYDTWFQMERSGRFTAATGRYFELLEAMVEWRDNVEPGACEALDLFIARFHESSTKYYRDKAIEAYVNSSVNIMDK